MVAKLGRLLSSANCSTNFYTETAIGTPNATGSYDGLIGLIQRDVVDFALVVVRADALPYDPGKLTAPFYSADVAVISSIRGRDVEIHNDIISFLNLDSTVMIYTFVSLFFFVTIIMTCNDFDEPTNISPMRTVECYSNNCRIMIYMLLNQEQFSPSRLVGFILTLSVALFSLFGVNGILLSTVGANLIAKRSPPKIDTLDQLLESPAIPTVVTNLLSWDAIKSSPVGTKVHQLKQKIDHNRPNSMFTVDFTGNQLGNEAIAQVSGQINQINEGKKALVMARAYGKYALDASCFTRSIIDFSDRVHVSSESFAAGMFTSLMSNNIHPYIEKIVSNLYTTFLETGQNDGLWQNILPQVPDLVGSMIPGARYNSTTIQCLERNKKKEDEQFRPLTLRHMKGAFFILLISFIGCSLVLAAEIAHKFMARDRKRRQIECLRNSPEGQWSTFVPESHRLGKVIIYR